MSRNKLMQIVESTQLTKGRDVFNIGDTVDIHVKIVEGDKQRIQIFTGTVISMNGHGTNASFTVRRLVGAQGVERVFPLHSPSIDKIEVKRRGRVRRSKLYYLRDRIGKATKVTEKRGLALATSDAPNDDPRGEAVKPVQAPKKPSADA
ncbi:MAG: 50S ribosomal protein L19 [Planctomycetes bacterium]|nr:50S ribosomal protein L19 [Planctomycetota bacterium]